MTTIEAMSISGIRSFSPDGIAQKLRFYKPLTLIVGQNGAGKTTVIECLKYATTGEYPPGSNSGQAFVHDTRVAGESNVKAKIQLRFRDVNGVTFVCTRQLQLTQNARTQQCRTMGGTLFIKNPKDNSKLSKSGRCSELDTELPELMGVTKPILQHVIFCHQEDSNWPLSDSATLKKRFDAIFAATRYTKAVEALRKQKKEQDTENMQSTLRLEHLTTIRERSLELQRDLLRDRESNDQLLAELTAYDERIAELDAERDRALKKIRQSRDGFSNLKAQERMLETMRDELRHFEGSLKQVFSESDDVLLEKLATLDKHCDGLKSNQALLQRKLSKLVEENALRQRSIQKATAELAHLQSTLNRQREMANQRAVLLTTSSLEPNPLSVLKLSEASAVEESQAMEAHTLLSEELSSRKEQLKELNRSHQFELRESQTLLDETRTKLATLSERTRQIQVNLDQNAKERLALEDNVRQEESLANNINSLKLSLSTKAKEEQALSQQLNDLRTNHSLDDLQSQIDELDAQSTDLLAQIADTSANQQQMAHSRLLEKSMGEKQDRLHQALQRVPDECLKHADITNNKYRQSLQECHTKLSVQMAREQQLREDLNQRRGAIRSVRQQLSNQQKTLASLRKKHTALIAKLSLIGASQENPLPELLELAETKAKEARSQVDTTEAAQVLYSTFSSSLDAAHSCPLCDRGFDTPAGLQALREKLNTQQAGIPALLETQRQQLKDAETHVANLRPFRTVWDDLQRFETELPEAEQRAQYSQAEQSSAEEVISKLESELLITTGAVRELNVTKQTFEELVRLSTEYEQERARFEEEKHSLGLTSDDSRSLSELNDELKALQTKLADVKEEYSQKQARLREVENDHRQAVRQLQQLQDSILKSQASAQALARVHQEQNRLQAVFAALQESSMSAEKLYQEAERLLATQQQEHENIVKKAHSEKTALSDQVLKLDQVLGKLKSISHQISSEGSYEENGQRLQLKEQQLAQLTEEYSRNEGTIAKVREDIEKDQATVSQQEIKRRAIEDNVELRRREQKNVELQKSIDDLKTTLQVDADTFSKLEETVERNEIELTQYRSKRDRCQGLRSAVLNSIKETTERLKSATFRNIQEQYQSMLIKVQVSRFAASDLQKYQKALESALMQFHTQKMSEINKIIKELWQTVYQGRDIDTIEIRAEQATSRARSYNYRVVMLKDGIELDMRGRCSAGQKVLASLVIRLALAETFCLNCGILALDEPSLALDRRNIESLAKALCRLLETRKDHQNFQLLVITHDEEFVQMLGKSNHADYFWRVSKNEAGHSTIQCHNISELD